MARKIENVTVEGISLVTKDYTPAVERAETRFALFKAKPKWLQKLQETFGLAPEKPVKKGFKRKKILSKKQTEDLESIQKTLSDIPCA